MSDVVFLNDARVLTASFDGNVLLWTCPDGILERSFSHRPSHIQRIAVAGNLLALGYRDGWVALFNIADGSRIAAFEAHAAAVRDLTFNPAGDQLATASGDQHVKVWSATSGVLLFDIVAYADTARHVAYSPRGDYLLSAGIDASAMLTQVCPTFDALIQMAADATIRTLTASQRAAFFLQRVPPDWTLSRRLWPYHSKDWAAWTDRVHDDPDTLMPPLPSGLPETRRPINVRAFLMGGFDQPEYQPR